jgi:hypothetical protein
MKNGACLQTSTTQPSNNEQNPAASCGVSEFRIQKTEEGQATFMLLDFEFCLLSSSDVFAASCGELDPLKD